MQCACLSQCCFISLSQTFVILCLFCDNTICEVPTVCVCVCRKSGDLENIERLLIDPILMFVPEYLEISATDMQKSSHVTAIFVVAIIARTQH
jgi:hypothetical protein